MKQTRQVVHAIKHSIFLDVCGLHYGAKLVAFKELKNLLHLKTLNIIFDIV